jgi:AraC-like DNA-binding protein
LSGSTVAIIDGVPWNASAGDILIYNRGVYHQEITEKSSGFSLLCIGFAGVRLPGLPENHICDKKAPMVLHTGYDFEMFRMLFTRIFEIVRTGDAGQAPMLGSYLNVLLGEVLLKCEEQKDLSSPRPASKKNLAEKILVWLNQHYTEQVSLQRIARELSMSPDYVSHTFKKQYGYSPMQYVNILRVGQAQTRLIDTKDKIADIATDVGFNNIGNFNFIIIQNVKNPFRN